MVLVWNIFLNCSQPLCSHTCLSEQLFLCWLNDDLDLQFDSEDTSVDVDYKKELEEPSIKSLAEGVRSSPINSNAFFILNKLSVKYFELKFL